MFQLHPLDSLTPQEISLAAQIIKSSHPTNKIIFRVLTLLEPPKYLLAPYLSAEHAGRPLPPTPPRCAQAQWYLDSITSFWEGTIDLDARTIISKERLEGRHSYTDAEEMQASEVACLADEGVKKVLEALELPEEGVVCVEPWTYGTDGVGDMAVRRIMCYLYMRIGKHLDSNHFAYPLDICVEMSGERKVLKITRLPTGEEDVEVEVGPQTMPKKFDRKKLHSWSEYHPELVGEVRTTTKPLLVKQPEGPSFKVEGNLLTWEKWRMRIGFNYREGLTIHDITYDGRMTFYRLSLSEMFVPYGDPRSPYPRKAAFDLGNNGAGVNANNLKLGCDCLGHIKYFDTYSHSLAGDPVKMPNVVCCHEVDDGILWKHTNYRTATPILARSRILILQTIITVGNYEYIFAFTFSQAASITYEVRATGILSTSPIDYGTTSPYGTLVAPGVLAPYHQHLFSLRIDPAIDGHNNTLAIEESHALPPSTASKPNPTNLFNVGYTTTTTPVRQECGLDTSIPLNRVFKIQNENIKNRITGDPVAYQLVPHPSQMTLAHPDSFHAKRSEFGEHAVWVTRYKERELFASGVHTMQSSGGEGVASWIKRRKKTAEAGSGEDETSVQDETSVRNEDIVIWHTFGTTHNPRIEDWPVMPAEKMVVTLKPVGFFERNPGIDVKGSSLAENGSVLVGEGEKEGCCEVETKL